MGSEGHGAGASGGFAGSLPPADAAALLAAGTVRRFRAGETLFHEGDRGTHVVLIETGRVKVVTTSPDGHETVVTLRGPGDLVGEMGALSGDEQGVRSASVLAIDPVQARVITSAELRVLLEARPKIALAVIALLAHRLRDTERRRAEQGSVDLPRRLARLLGELVDGHGVALSQQELAGLLGTSRESIVRALSTLRSEGLITTGRRTIDVVDRDALDSFAR